MKRIDIERPTTTQAESAGQVPQSAWNDAWNQQLGRTAEIYGRLFAAMRDDFASLVQRRIDADLETARCWGNCRNVTEVLDLQQKWLRGAIEHYTQHGQRVAELCQAAVSEPMEAAKSAEATSPKGPAERKSASEHAEGSDRRAA